MTMKCPCCGLTNARKGNNATGDTMFFPLIDGTDDCLVFCVACRNVVAGPPGEDGYLYVPSDERLAAELTAIQKTARHIRDTDWEVQKNIESPRPHQGRPCERYNVRDDGGIEFCFKKGRDEKFVVNMVKATLDKLGIANAHPTDTSTMCRRQCPSKKGYEHVAVKIVAMVAADG